MTLIQKNMDVKFRSILLEHTFLPLPACLFSVRESVSCVVAKCSALPLGMEDLVLLNKFLDYYYECVF